MASSVYCDDPYLSSLVIENLKDRAITIFEIYLKVGNHCYIQIEDFDPKPLVLRAYETYQKEYGPIEFYSVNMKRVGLSELLSGRTVKKRARTVDEWRKVRCTLRHSQVEPGLHILPKLPDMVCATGAHYLQGQAHRGQYRLCS